MKKSKVLEIIDSAIIAIGIQHGVNGHTCRLVDHRVMRNRCNRCPLYEFSRACVGNGQLHLKSIQLFRQRVIDCKAPAVFLDIKRIQNL